MDLLEIFFCVVIAVMISRIQTLNCQDCRNSNSFSPPPPGWPNLWDPVLEWIYVYVHDYDRLHIGILDAESDRLQHSNSMN